MVLLDRRTKNKIIGLIFAIFCIAVYDKYNSFQDYLILNSDDEQQKALLEEKKTRCTRNATTNICVCLNIDTGKRVERTQEECLARSRRI